MSVDRNSDSDNSEIDLMLRDIEAKWPKVDMRALRRTRWYHNLPDDARAYFDSEIEVLYNSEGP